MKKQIFTKVGVVLGFVCFFILGGIIGAKALWVVIVSVLSGIILDYLKNEADKKVSEEDYYYDVSSVEKLCHEIGQKIKNDDKKIDIIKGAMNYKIERPDDEQLHCVLLDGDINRKIISVFTTREIGELIISATNGKYILKKQYGDTYYIQQERSEDKVYYIKNNNYSIYRDVADKLVEYYNNNEEKEAFVDVIQGNPVNEHAFGMENLMYYYSVHISINELEFPVLTEMGSLDNKLQLDILKLIVDSTGGIYKSDSIGTVSLTETSFSKLLEIKKGRMSENEDIKNWCSLFFENKCPEYFGIVSYEIIYGQKYGEKSYLRYIEYGYNNMTRCDMLALAYVINSYAGDYYCIVEENNMIEMVKKDDNKKDLKKW